MSEINNEKKEKLKELLGSELVEKVYANLGNRLIEDMSIDKVDKIVQVFKEQGLSLEIIEKCSSILVWGNENEIREILKVLDEKECEISFVGEVNPIIFKGLGNDELIQLVLPIRTY